MGGAGLDGRSWPACKCLGTEKNYRHGAQPESRALGLKEGWASSSAPASPPLPQFSGEGIGPPGGWCFMHPDAAAHEALARQLAGFVRRALPWFVGLGGSGGGEPAEGAAAEPGAARGAAAAAERAEL